VFRILDELTRLPGEDIVRRVLREGLTAKLANITCLLARSGHEIPIEDSAAPIKDRDGKWDALTAPCPRGPLCILPSACFALVDPE
jgi:hypothetical protein